ncbi:MAG: lipopolysaccharide biosynthesis protein [Clostridiales bacterium]|nr:lipopolysaccharide biosynthesis protein [Clostridiales bacterium]
MAYKDYKLQRGDVMEKHNVLTNLFWRFAERSGAQLVSFVVSIVLARMLQPEDYGVVALITVFATILQVFVDSGLGNALIQKKDADDLDFSTVFYTNVMFCGVLYVLLFLCAPLIARFYGDSSLSALIRVLGITIIVSGVKNIQQAYVSKNMMFRKFFFATLGGTVTAACVGIAMAMLGYGVWALVVQHVINVIIDTVILWITVKWRPHNVFSVQRLKKLFSYGWKLLISTLLDKGYNNIRQLIIGKMYSSADLAYYNRGRQFPNFVVSNVNSAIDSVLFPVMSSVQDNRQNVKDMTRRAINVSVYVMAPLMMGLVATADFAVGLVLTSKWLPCVPYLRIFCISFMFHPIHTANLNAIKAMGRSDLFLKLEVIKKCAGLVLLISTMWFGPMAMAYSMLASSIISQVINSWPNRKLLNYGYMEQLKDIMPCILLAVGMGAVVWCVSLAGLPVLITLMIQVVLGAVIYIVGSALFKLDSFLYLIDILKAFRRTKNKA